MIREMRRGRTPSVERMQALCRVLDLEFYIGPRRPAGENLSDEPHWAVELRNDLIKSQQEIPLRVREALATRQESTRHQSPIVEFHSGKGRAVGIRELEAAAGSGALALDDTVKGYVYFCIEWIRKHGINPERCSVIGVTGESMEPTLPNGCSILLDHGRTRLRDGAIFVVRTGDGVMVRRAKKTDGGMWMLDSDHEAWEPITLAADAVVIGEVKWMGRDL